MTAAHSDPFSSTFGDSRGASAVAQGHAENEAKRLAADLEKIVEVPDAVALWQDHHDDWRLGEHRSLLDTPLAKKLTLEAIDARDPFDASANWSYSIRQIGHMTGTGLTAEDDRNEIISAFDERIENLLGMLLKLDPEDYYDQIDGAIGWAIAELVAKRTLANPESALLRAFPHDEYILVAKKVKEKTGLTIVEAVEKLGEKKVSYVAGDLVMHAEIGGASWAKAFGRGKGIAKYDGNLHRSYLDNIKRRLMSI